MIACFERASWIAQVFLQELEKVSGEQELSPERRNLRIPH